MKKILYILIALTALVVVSSILIFSMQKEKLKSGPIIFFGNSLTAGVGAQMGEDFPTLIGKKLDLNNVINAGVPGDTTDDALLRLDKDVLAENPSIVIVEFSGNDFLGNLSPEKTFQNLDKIVEKITQTNAKVVLVHIKYPQKQVLYKDGFEKIKKKYHAKIVWDSMDGILNNPSLMSDAIHPNSKGYSIMAERIAKVLKGYL